MVNFEFVMCNIFMCTHSHTHKRTFNKDFNFVLTIIFSLCLRVNRRKEDDKPFHLVTQ